jgi:uncharacterized protein (DUF1697 family)
MAGHNSIKMTDLAELYLRLGFGDVRTFIQSGNVIFSSSDEHDMKNISTIIESAISERFNFKIPVILRSVQELKDLMLLNPFIEEKSFDSSKMSVIFLYQEPQQTQIDKVSDVNYPPDKFMIFGKEIFIYCPNGFGKTKLYTNFFENKMSVVGTARNWKTINELLEIAEKTARSDGLLEIK